MKMRKWISGIFALFVCLGAFAELNEAQNMAIDDAVAILNDTTQTDEARINSIAVTLEANQNDEVALAGILAAVMVNDPANAPAIIAQICKVVPVNIVGKVAVLSSLMAESTGVDGYKIGSEISKELNDQDARYNAVSDGLQAPGSAVTDLDGVTAKQQDVMAKLGGTSEQAGATEQQGQQQNNNDDDDDDQGAQGQLLINQMQQVYGGLVGGYAGQLQ